jgi:hypothetical protein
MAYRSKGSSNESMFVNFALTFAKAVLVLSIALFVMISPETKKADGIKPKVEMMISVTWPGELNHDVDTWLRTPSGKIVYYNNKEAGFVQLERDVLGYTNGGVLTEGGGVLRRINQELVTFRGIEPGEYVLNLHLYSAGGVALKGEFIDPFNVQVMIDKLNPEVKSVFNTVVQLNEIKEEVHVVRFTMKEDGSITDVRSDLPTRLRDELTQQPITPNGVQ